MLDGSTIVYQKVAVPLVVPVFKKIAFCTYYDMNNLMESTDALHYMQTHMVKYINTCKKWNLSGRY